MELRRQQLAIAFSVGIVAMLVSLWQLNLPEFLSFYDTGVYVAAAIHFIHGTLPYSRFNFVEPPGIVLVLSPVAALSHLIGTSGAMETARVLSVVVSGVNVSVLAWLVRARGRIAMVAAGVALSSLPVAAYVDSGVKLDLYCVSFALLSALAAFGGPKSEELLSPRRAVVSGLLMGMAMLVKFFAFFPLVAALVVIIRYSRRRACEFAAAAAGMFALVCVPFFIAAPRNFISQVFIDQIVRRGSAPANLGAVFDRLKMLTGFAYSAYQPSSVVTVGILLLVGAIMIEASLRRSQTTDIDDFLVLSSVLLAVGLMFPDHTSDYYYYVPAPFLIGAVVTSVARLGPRHLGAIVRARLSRQSATLVRAAAIASVVGVTIGSALWATTANQAEAWAFGVQTSWSKVLERQIPVGACVLYSQIYYGLASDRFTDDGSQCPPVVDTYGLWLAWGDDPQNPPPGFVRLWRSDLARSSYAVFSYGSSANVPWTPGLHAWFSSHYRLLHSDRGFQVFQRIVTPQPS